MARKRDVSKKPGRRPGKAQNLIPKGYHELLTQLKERIRSAQLRAGLAVNRELIELYWQIGQSIVKRQRSEGWGKSVVERLAQSLQAEFPGMSGFSPRNVWRMRAFYLAYTEEVRKLPRPVAELDGAVQIEKPSCSRVRAARPGQARWRVELYHQARRVAAPCPAREPAKPERA